jgi:hypothetical protein
MLPAASSSIRRHRLTMAAMAMAMAMAVAAAVAAQGWLRSR